MTTRLVWSLLFVGTVFGNGEDDLVTNLPGLLFNATFKTYSGYLNANEKNTWKMHYMITESRDSPDTDPLLVWFNGGPGCSSTAGLFEELGPFQVNIDGATLYENPYSWNLKANVLYLESPIGVGFSYDTTTDAFSDANDYQSAWQNYNALKDFFTNVQPKYANRTFFLSGESYAGIYIPMLSSFLVQGINNGTFPNTHFQGAAIGNGFMNVKHLLNSLVLWSAYHARVSVYDWETIKKECYTPNTPGIVKNDADTYDFTQNMWSELGNGIDFVGRNDTTCGLLINPLITTFEQMFPYNYYQDCYDGMYSQSTGMIRRYMAGSSRARRSKRDTASATHYTNSQDISPNTAMTINRRSTDNQWGYNCWNEAAVETYLNRADVQAALHITDGWKKQNNGTYRWRDCNEPIYDQYHITVNDTMPFFNDVLMNVKTKGFRFLIYNGDVDTVCNYLGDAWHIRDVAAANNLQFNNRTEWYYSNNDQVAGFVQRYTGISRSNTDVTIDLLTVKGAGHMVPTDRPGPSAQMISNFMFPQANGIDYSNSIINSDPVLLPMLPTTGGSSSVFGLAGSLLVAYLYM